MNYIKGLLLHIIKKSFFSNSEVKQKNKLKKQKKSKKIKNDLKSE